MDTIKQENSPLQEARQLIDEQNYQAAVDLLTAHLQQSPDDYEAQFHLARAYVMLQDYTHSFEWCKKAADEGQLPIAWAFLALHYCEGTGCVKSGPDALHYVNLAAASEDPAVQHDVHLCRGVMYYTGVGVARNIPEAYRQFAAISDNSLADQYIAQIQEKYPVMENGEIDLSQRKRSKWATAALVIMLLHNLILAIGCFAGEGDGLSWVDGLLSLLLVVPAAGVLAWQSWAFKWLLAVAAAIIPVTMLCVAFDFSSFALTLNAFYYPLAAATLLIRRNGFAHPWCSLSGKPDNGSNPLRRLLDIVLCYGEGNAFQHESAETKVFEKNLRMATGIVGVLGVWAGISLMLSDIGWDVEWNIFKSPSLWMFFSFIGFFLQFFDWQHTSYDHVTEVTYADGSKKRYKSRDIMDTMEGQFLMPLLSHLIFIPAMYGAMIYYVLMAILALISSLVPYVAGAAALGSIYGFSLCGQKLAQRKFRSYLLIAVGVVFGLIYVSAIGYTMSGDGTPVSAVTKQDTKRFVQCTGNEVNLRQSPSASSARLFAEPSCSGRLYFNASPSSDEYPYQLSQGSVVEWVGESGEWYQVRVSGTRVYALKKYFKVIYPASVEVGLKQVPWMSTHALQRSSGDYKGKVVYYSEDEMENCTDFYIGTIEGDHIHFTQHALLSWDGQQVQYDTNQYKAIYPDCPMKKGADGAEVIDLQKLSDKKLKQFFAQGEAVNVRAYYFKETNEFLWIYE